MPVPKPRPKEKQEDFMSRCMGSEVMMSEFPTHKQRAAVCLNMFSEHKSKATATEETMTDKTKPISASNPPESKGVRTQEKLERTETDMVLDEKGNLVPGEPDVIPGSNTQDAPAWNESNEVAPAASTRTTRGKVTGTTRITNTR